MKHDMRKILGEDFFEDEMRCDYLIPKKMKRVFAVLLDLYMTFTELCDKHGLRYYANSGFLLGAVRHKGFIPWDDDLDVAMPREDYNKLMEIAPKELKYPFFLRTPYTDPECYYSSIAFMNLSTSFVPKIFRNKSFKMGIPMDIFPLDNCDPSFFDSDREQIYTHIMRCSTWMKKGCEGLNEQQISNFSKYHTDNPLHDWECIQKIAANPNYINSEYCTISVITLLKKEHVIYPKIAFRDFITLPFEGINVRVPIDYEQLLEIQYGDWKRFPPIEERGKKNEQILFDPDKSYTDYLSNN